MQNGPKKDVAGVNLVEIYESVVEIEEKRFRFSPN